MFSLKTTIQVNLRQTESVFCRLRIHWIHLLFYFLARDVWTRDIEDGDEYYCLIERFIDGESSKTPTYERHLQQAIEESLEATRKYNQPQISEVGGQQSSAHEINEEEVKNIFKIWGVWQFRSKV